MENLNSHDTRCLDWSVQNYDKVHWLPRPSAAVFPHQKDVKVQNCKRRLSDEHQYSNCKCQTRWFSSARYGKSQWAALDQRLRRASSETLARYCASDSINSSSTQDQRKGLHWATWPDQSKGTQHHITLSPQFAQDWDSETSTIRTKRIIKNGQERSKRKANHMTLTKALTSACFPPLPSQKHLSCSTSAPGQVWTVSSQNLLDSEVATRLLATHATHTSPSAMPNKWLKSHTFQPQKQRCPHLTVACASRVCLVENRTKGEILCISCCMIIFLSLSISNLRPKIQAKSFSSVAVMPSSSRIQIRSVIRRKHGKLSQRKNLRYLHSVYESNLSQVQLG